MTTEPKTTNGAPANNAVRHIDLQTILGSDREVIIRHRNEEYRLRLTSNDKLLLTK
jgi:hemin uptake protein HemP